MPVLDQDRKPRFLVLGVTALALVILGIVFFNNNQPSEVPGYTSAVETPADQAPVATPQ